MALQVGGNLRPNSYFFLRVPVADANYTVTTDPVALIAYTSITATRTVTLPTPTALSTGRTFTVKDESGSVTALVNIHIVGAGGETINGAAALDIILAYGTASLYTNGVNYFTY